MDTNNDGLDLHCQSILLQYGEYQDVLKKMQEIVTDSLHRQIMERGIYINALESRIKTRESLVGKLRLKGYKYNSLTDLTDILGVRVITFYSDEVDKIAAMAESLFEIDWENSVDKRKVHDLNSFGYMSLHYICRIPKSMFYDEKMPEVNEVRFELQMRTALQHVWANMHHDTGYKSGVEVPQAHLRTLNCMAGMLELVDEQFSRIRTEINDYRRRVKSLVAGGNFDEVQLNTDTFDSYLELKPFQPLMLKIAAINQAEIYHDSLSGYVIPLKKLGFNTLGDIERLIKRFSEDAFQIALHQIGGTDVDILAESMAVNNLCTVYIIQNGGGVSDLEKFFNMLGGAKESNKVRAEHVMQQAERINLVKK